MGGASHFYRTNEIDLFFSVLHPLLRKLRRIPHSSADDFIASGAVDVRIHFIANASTA